MYVWSKYNIGGSLGEVVFLFCFSLLLLLGLVFAFTCSDTVFETLLQVHKTQAQYTG